MSVLVGYLDTPEGHAALDAAIDEAHLRSVPLVVVNSPREGATVDAHMLNPEQVEAALVQAREKGVEASARQPLHGDKVSDTLLGLIDELDVTLIVIGLRHRSPVGKLIMGSNAQRILLDATVPVLAVKATR